MFDSFFARFRYHGTWSFVLFQDKAFRDLLVPDLVYENQMGTAFSYSHFVNSRSVEGLVAKCSCLRESIKKRLQGTKLLCCQENRLE